MTVDRIVPFLVAAILVFANWTLPEAYSLWFSVISILIVNIMEYFPNWIQLLRAKRNHQSVADRSFLKKFARNMTISFILIVGALIVRYFRTL
ncbi:hypothetical protein [Clostridium sp. D33t1_170424_F3]|uniref:hypothetical protein n=1 Tax=Clostridium sp. D33t1_170424_F3 TaxID=2787099 RepID=UPI0018A9A169|nr:hypothetical protein [Clostridium sp. D33t1_170424_F3]